MNLFYMKIFTAIMLGGLVVQLSQSCKQQAATPHKDEHRAEVHFTPEKNWVNDPNGMVYHNGIYHLFFQYNPNASVWGPMHWGHATSKDLIHWTRQPVALYPDSLGTIFSGSAVVDVNNTSGFGKNGQAPLVAIYTSHNEKAEKTGTSNFQTQSIAYSNDEGKTWVKYEGNPVVKNPGIRDFRDPKVMWYEPQKKWIMTLATLDRITFYSSPDLKNWKKESEFGKDTGAHGGVWECPDLFSLTDESGKEVWVLIVNLNPGGPNMGSATQYFTGSFDGKNFTSSSAKIKWLDYGPDEYAGITWSNTGNRKIFLGWMSNWMYANVVPTTKWRNAMTIPRELQLKTIGEDVLIASKPVAELNAIQMKPTVAENVKLSEEYNLSEKTEPVPIPCRINLHMDEVKDFSLVLSNETGNEVVIGFDKNANRYFIDRTKSGKTDFKKEFAVGHVAPRFVNSDKMDITLIIDVSSVELFADDGLTVMTSIFFPDKPFNKIYIKKAENVSINRIEYVSLKSIWE
jgi:fructan beta-fructosidase